MPYIHICLYYFLILYFYFQLFDTLLTRRHSTIYNVWFDFITSVRKLKSNLELNNPKLTSDTIGKFILCTLRCWKGHWWPLGEKFLCFIGVKGKFRLIFTKMHFLIFPYAFSTMNPLCSNALNSHLFTFWDNNYDIKISKTKSWYNLAI